MINLLGGHIGQTINVTNTASDVYTDVNGDFVVSARDALMVINALARQRINPEAEAVSKCVAESDFVHSEADWGVGQS